MKTLFQRKGPFFVQRMVICMSLITGTSYAGETPFGFEMGKTVASQLPRCAEVDGSRQCVELTETQGTLQVYQLRQARNILGGVPQSVHVVEGSQGIEQVQVAFPIQTAQRVKALLQAAFGEPSAVMDDELMLNDCAVPTHFQHWVLEDGVITLQVSDSDSGEAYALIRTPEDFQRVLKPAVSATAQWSI